MAQFNSPIGAPVVRAEGPDKVTGRALYAADIVLPGMLWAKVLRSPAKSRAFSLHLEIYSKLFKWRYLCGMSGERGDLAHVY